ncbi:hypothetical protein BDZ90DRAFT_234694, partial [Jaminaea rosea]
MTDSPDSAALEQLSIASLPSVTPTTETQKQSSVKHPIAAAAAADAAAKAAAKMKVLHIEAGQSAPKLERTLISLHGNCPRDEPLEQDAATSDVDRRMLGPLTLRYRSTKGNDLIIDAKAQNQITEAIWMRLKQLMPSHSPQSIRPAIAFDEDCTSKDGNILPCINIVCSTVESFVVTRNGITKIEHQEDSQQADVYELHCWSNTLPGDIFPIDFPRLPLDDSCLTEFQQALDDAVSDIGVTIGVGRVQFKPWQTDDTTTSANVIRAYIRLSAGGMKLNFTDLVESVPSFFRWKGVEFSMLHPGRTLRQRHSASVEYPEERRPKKAAQQATTMPV